MEDTVVRKTDSILIKRSDGVVCLPGARKEHVTHRESRADHGKRKWRVHTPLVHIGTNNANKEGTTSIVDKCMHRLTKTARFGHIILSGILPMFGNMIQRYRNSKRMAFHGMLERLCKEEEPEV